jgi:tRNA A-37 threonylcarbamoyl transferase component Bud32
MHDSSSANAPQPTLTAEFREAYELERFLGRGAQAIVYKARHRRLQRDVAVKFLKAMGAYARLRFVREANALAALVHPRVIRLYDADVVGEVPFVVMELLEGRSLSDLLALGPMSTTDAMEIVRQTAEGLAFLHAKGLVHRDLKPSNIMLAEDGVKIADFGLSRYMQQGWSITGAGNSVGTPNYMSPEQIRGERVTTASDVYGLGVMFHELFAGERPFPRSDLNALLFAHLMCAPPDLCEQCPGVDPAVAALVRRMLSKLPSGRPCDGAAVLEELDRIDCGSKPAPAREPEPAQEPSPAGPEPSAPSPRPRPAVATPQPVARGPAPHLPQPIAAPCAGRRPRPFAAAILAGLALLGAAFSFASRAWDDPALLEDVASLVQNAAHDGLTAGVASGGVANPAAVGTAAAVPRIYTAVEVRRLLAMLAEPHVLSVEDMKRKRVTPLIGTGSAPELESMIALVDIVDHLKRSHLTSSTGTWLPANPLTVEMGIGEPAPGGTEIEVALSAPGATWRSSCPAPAAVRFRRSPGAGGASSPVGSPRAGASTSTRSCSASAPGPSSRSRSIASRYGPGPRATPASPRPGRRHLRCLPR